jgi:hypothetical protein
MQVEERDRVQAWMAGAGGQVRTETDAAEAE